MTTRNSSKRGFTLIEALIYLALFSIIIGGAIISSYSIVESLGRNEAKAVLQEEGNFLMGKINWVLSGASTIDAPAANAVGSTLRVTKWDPLAASPITIALDGTNITIRRGTASAQILNNDNVQVTALSFKHTYPGGTNPEGLETTLTLTSRTPNGMTITQTFTSTNYLRR